MPDRHSAAVLDSILRPTADEARDTHVLFLARHATDSSDAARRQFGYPVVYHSLVLRTLREMGFTVTPASELDVLFGPMDFDFVYSIHTHGAFDGHEVLAPAVAAFRGIPCLGSPAAMRSLAEDKVLAKQFAASLGVDVAEHRLFNPLVADASAVAAPGRWMIKPRTGVLSDAIYMVKNPAEWKKALAAACDPRHLGREFMAEAFVPGLNLTVPAIEGLPPKSLAVFEERGSAGDNILTREGKTGHTPEYASEPYTGPGAEAALAATAKLAAAMAPYDYARFDYRYDPKADRLVFLEVNIGCAMGPASVVAKSAALHGVDYKSLVGHIITHSLRRQRLELA